MTTYRVTARRSGDWWALEVPDLPGVYSQTKRLDRAASQAREAIAVMLDIEPEDVQVKVEPQLAPEVQDVLQAVTRARKAAEAAADAEREALRRAASVLTRNLSQRDAGEVMGVSFQRISQLLKPSTPRRPRGARKQEEPRERQRAGKRVA